MAYLLAGEGGITESFLEEVTTELCSKVTE